MAAARVAVEGGAVGGAGAPGPADDCAARVEDGGLCCQRLWGTFARGGGEGVAQLLDGPRGHGGEGLARELKGADLDVDGVEDGPSPQSLGLCAQTEAGRRVQRLAVPEPGRYGDRAPPPAHSAAAHDGGRGEAVEDSDEAPRRQPRRHALRIRQVVVRRLVRAPRELVQEQRDLCQLGLHHAGAAITRAGTAGAPVAANVR
ncbi:hypothetical protein M885DRAFT_543093 [Pelagophyceae sp. CCMP2097]|nr:hypothetical protein M885DRAFT_543093 [Pelagophyceae sp. CCMP2097]